LALNEGTVTLPWVVAQAVAAIALGLLAASGVAKLADPAPTTGAMRSAGLPASDIVTRSLGIIEVALSVVSLVVGGPAVIGAAVLYAGFTIFTFAAVRNRIPVQSCGCFGREDTPPTWAHVAYNAVSTAALVWLAALGVAAIDWDLPVFELISFGLFALVGVYASYLLLARLPQVLQAVRP
jgi:Methylamine utilisation protein MauE